MPQRDTVDFLSAFGIGAVAGAALALLLRPEPPGRGERIREDLEPHRKKVRESARRARRHFGAGASAAADAGSALQDAGRELLHDFWLSCFQIVQACLLYLVLMVALPTRRRAASSLISRRGKPRRPDPGSG